MHPNEIYIINSSDVVLINNRKIKMTNNDISKKGRIHLYLNRNMQLTDKSILTLISWKLLPWLLPWQLVLLLRLLYRFLLILSWDFQPTHFLWPLF